MSNTKAEDVAADAADPGSQEALSSVYERNLSRVRKVLFGQEDPHGTRIDLENILSNVFCGSITFPSSSLEEVKKAKSALAAIVAASAANVTMDFGPMIVLAEKNLADVEKAAKSSPDEYTDEQCAAILLREFVDARIPLSGIDPPRTRTPRATKVPAALSWQEKASLGLQGHSVDLLPTTDEEFGEWSKRVIEEGYVLTFQVSKERTVSSSDFAAGETVQQGVHRLYRLLGFSGRLPVPSTFKRITFPA